MQRKMCLVWPFLYFVRYTCSFKLTFMRYLYYMFRSNSTIMCLHGQLGGGGGLPGGTFASGNLSGNRHFILSKV